MCVYCLCHRFNHKCLFNCHSSCAVFLGRCFFGITKQWEEIPETDNHVWLSVVYNTYFCHQFYVLKQKGWGERGLYWFVRNAQHNAQIAQPIAFFSDWQINLVDGLINGWLLHLTWSVQLGCFVGVYIIAVMTWSS